jgi:hypothetical protein
MEAIPLRAAKGIVACAFAVNATLERRTRLQAVTLNAPIRALRGRLLYLIDERNRPTIKQIISALATNLGPRLRCWNRFLRNVLAQAKLDLWVREVKELHLYYSRCSDHRN